MSTFSEIDVLSIALDNAAEQIDCALDQGNRRHFKLWARRRADLVARRERLLLAAATAEVPA